MKKLIAAAAAVVAMAGSHAATTPVASFTFANTITEINNTGNLPMFDSTLGTLTGVTLNILGTSRQAFQLTNNGPATEEVGATSRVSIRWDSSLLPLDGILDAGDPWQVLALTSPFGDLASGATRNTGPTDVNETDAVGVGAILAAFVGTGNFTLNCRSTSGFALEGGGGNVGSLQQTTAGCGANIVYTYDPAVVTVPEPTSLALVGLALAGLGYASRRKA